METILDPIQERFVPPVAGIDLEQALNYVMGPSLDWFYVCFTYPRVFYKAGSRPELERWLQSRGLRAITGLVGLQDLADAVYQAVVHHSLLGNFGEADLGLNEEGVLDRGCGWCNEQARVLAVLAQIAGVPSRLVFAAMPNKLGHVLTEVFLEGRWILIDQTAKYIFKDADDRPLNVLDLRSGNSSSKWGGERYRRCLLDERMKAKDEGFWDQYVPYGLVDDATLLFSIVGYCNYFVH